MPRNPDKGIFKYRWVVQKRVDKKWVDVVDFPRGKKLEAQRAFRRYMSEDRTTPYRLIQVRKTNENYKPKPKEKEVDEND